MLASNTFPRPNAGTSPGVPKNDGAVVATSMSSATAIADRARPTRATAAGRMSPPLLNVMRFINTISLSLAIHVGSLLFVRFLQTSNFYRYVIGPRPHPNGGMFDEQAPEFES
jgi:hypothetical protein